MPADLVGGHYPNYQALQALFGVGNGQGGSSAQSNMPYRTNLEFPIFSGALVDTAGSTVPGTGVLAAVPVPVDPGYTVTKVSIMIGATAASTPTHNFAALYSGTTVAAPPFIVQSTDGATAAVAASTRFDFTLSAATTITQAQAPNGFIYVGFSFTSSTTMPSVITTPAGAAACQYRWFANTPLYFSQTAGSSLGGTAATTLVNASTLTVAPVVVIW